MGGAAALNILRYRVSDVVEDLAKGEALDMIQVAPTIEFDGKIRGTKDFGEMEGSEIVVITG